MKIWSPKSSKSLRRDLQEDSNLGLANDPMKKLNIVPGLENVQATKIPTKKAKPTCGADWKKLPNNTNGTVWERTRTNTNGADFKKWPFWFFNFPFWGRFLNLKAATENVLKLSKYFINDKLSGLLFTLKWKYKNRVSYHPFDYLHIPFLEIAYVSHSRAIRGFHCLCQ